MTPPSARPRVGLPLLLACACLLPLLGAARARSADDTRLAPRVTAHYVILAHARYTHALEAAQALLAAVNAFLAEPTPATHAAAKQAWIDAHTIYSHSEAYRFGNPNVDAWEPRVNAWPMDEGLIDYVSSAYVFHEGNPHALDNIVVEGRAPITDGFIAEFQSGADPKAAPITNISDVETNVTRGFHAVEFLLWGQDLNQPPASAGRRPHTDYVRGEGCTGGRCDRRRDYLSAAARLLVADLRYAVRDWDPDGELYAADFAELSLEEQLDRMILGLGTMGFGELAAERIQVALLTGDQEEEQSCFSDTTHLAILHNARGIHTLYLGEHLLGDGERVEGPSLAELVALLDPELDARLRRELAATDALAAEVVAAAEAGEPFDRMIQPDNAAGHARLEALIEALRVQTATLESVRALVPLLAER